jgi:pimeloyl-ACP methyl ester carboxylesterase
LAVTWVGMGGDGWGEPGAPSAPDVVPVAEAMALPGSHGGCAPRPTEPNHDVPTRDGRELAVFVKGLSHGVPVFFMHGTPGSRSGPLPRSVVLYRRGVRIVSYDRPGYGGSTRAEGRTVADAAYDVEDIADKLEIEKFAVLGRSGGGPHALAVAAMLPRRVTAVAAMVSLAPPRQLDLEWDAGMTDGNVDVYAAADVDEEELRARLTDSADRARRDPETFIDERVEPGILEVDRRVVEDVAIRRQLKDVYREGLALSADGWIDDVLAFRRDWKFEPADIKASVLLWHGRDDTFSPVSHTQWLARRIRGRRVEVEIEPNTGHFGAVERLPRVLSWLVDRHREAVDPDELTGVAITRTEAAPDLLSGGRRSVRP